jgi:GcrA cell cycle regulator
MTKWTEERIELLKQLTVEGRSASIIAALLGVTRNAVIGKWHRLRLSLNRPPRPRPSRPPRVPRAPAVIRKPQIAYITSLPFESPENPLTLFELEPHHCRWPVGLEGGPHLFCGNTVADGRSYCGRHCKMAHTDRPSRVVGVYFRPVLGGRIT